LPSCIAVNKTIPNPTTAPGPSPKPRPVATTGPSANPTPLAAPGPSTTPTETATLLVTPGPSEAPTAIPGPSPKPSPIATAEPPVKPMQFAIPEPSAISKEFAEALTGPEQYIIPGPKSAPKKYVQTPFTIPKPVDAERSLAGPSAFSGAPAPAVIVVVVPAPEKTPKVVEQPQVVPTMEQQEVPRRASCGPTMVAEPLLMGPPPPPPPQAIPSTSTAPPRAKMYAHSFVHLCNTVWNFILYVCFILL